MWEEKRRKGGRVVHEKRMLIISAHSIYLFLSTQSAHFLYVFFENGLETLVHPCMDGALAGAAGGGFVLGAAALLA